MNYYFSKTLLYFFISNRFEDNAGKGEERCRTSNMILQNSSF